MGATLLPFALRARMLHMHRTAAAATLLTLPARTARRQLPHYSLSLLAPHGSNRFTFGGTAYGLAATPGQFMNNRHGFRGPVQNLFVCGHSTRTGHGIAGAMMGGQRVAGYVHKHLS